MRSFTGFEARALTPDPSPVRGRGGEAPRISGTLRLPNPSRAIQESARRLRKEQTRSEAILWTALRNGRLDGRKFRRQHPVAGFILDFYCPIEHLAIEVDGRVHETTVDQDHRRQAHLEALGIRFVRLPADLIEKDLDAAIDRVRAALAAPLPSPAHGRGAGGEG